MADFCNFCYFNDIDYQEIINKHFSTILETMQRNCLVSNESALMYEHLDYGKAYVNGGMCEGCGMSGVVVLEKNGVFEIHSSDYDVDSECGLLGRLVTSNKKNVLIEKGKHHNHWLIEIDENSSLFKSFYHKKKENFEASTKTMKREFEAVKHIAYALYMIGNKPGIVSHHDCISFEEFDVKNYKSISNKAWKLYIESNEGTLM